MKTPLGKLLYWAPHGLGIALALFISIFALDAFGSGTLLEQIGGFLIHLIPTYLLVLALIIGWRWELAGGVLFLLLAGLYLATMTSRIPLGTGLMLASFPTVVGVLFVADWGYRRVSSQSVDQ